MKRVWQTPVKLAAGLIAAAVCAMPQAYTISARPGMVNYIEGDVYLAGNHINDKNSGKTSMNANDTLSTDTGKAEVLLTPGVFLRVGNDSEVKMLSPSLTDTRVEVTKGEAMLEVAELVKDNNIQIIDHGGTVRIEKTGLYRFTADEPPTAAVIEGKAEVLFDGKRVRLGNDRETVISDALKADKFDVNKGDDLYAWSHVRDEYVSAASYAAAKTVPVNGFYNNGLSYGPGFGGWYGPGWFWNSGWNSYAWLPGTGAFFSPFGFGYFAPTMIGYAPLLYTPVIVGGRPVAVPVNPKSPPAVGTTVRSPAANTFTNSQKGAVPALVTPAGTRWQGATPAIARGATQHSGAWARPSVAASAQSAPAASSGSSGGARSSAPSYSSAPISAPRASSPAPSGGGRR